MERHVIWFIVAGVLFISMAVAGSAIARLPLTTAMLYLGVGVLLGPYVSGLLDLDVVTHAVELERVTEIAVIVSLFTAGLKLRVPVLDRRWLVAVRLALVSMVVTVALVATTVVLVLGWPWGLGIILGAILAPTDPVLASDVQVEHPFDQNRLRFALTGEASLNDGTAFPFLMLGLGLLGVHHLGPGLSRWIAVDVLWATGAGITVGGVLGTVVGKFVLYLRRTHREALGLDDFLALGLIALAYGAALACHAYGFLAVFAAGLALRRVERMGSDDEVAADRDRAPAFMAQAVLAFNEQLERIGEVVIVVIVGSLLSPDLLEWRVVWLIPVLFIVIRPLSVLTGLAGAGVTGRERAMIAWFGVRGVGSAYYLAFAIVHGLPAAFREDIIGVTLAVIGTSVIVHGVTVTPFMSRWGEKAQAATPEPGPGPPKTRAREAPVS